MPMIATAIVRLVTMAGSLGLTGGCSLLLGIPDLGDPGNVASMTARFKATIQGQVRDPIPLDWGVPEQHIWRHYMGPSVVAVCGRPVTAPVTQRTYQINYYRGSFGNIAGLEVNTPAHPQADPSYDFCGTRPGDPQ